MNHTFFILFCIYGLIGNAQVNKNQKLPKQVSTIAFGSCAHQNKDLPILTTVLKEKPDVFIWTGDNIYGNTDDMEDLAAKYQKLGSKPEFKKLNEACPFIATWDDHDYAKNDAGGDYEMKAESKEVFLKFWNDPNDADRRSHEGIYTAYNFGDMGKHIQIIMLDTRYFRTALLEKGMALSNKLVNTDPNANVLGNEQWEWLEAQLKQPADLRLIVSSIQFGISHNGWEAWANFPLQQEKMINLIKTTEANGVFFISGDAHWGELSLIEKAGQYPLYDITSSGLAKKIGKISENTRRIGKGYNDYNYGLIEIDWKNKQANISIKNIDGKPVIEKALTFGELSF